jgi:imidazole glycerol-phosphate synthase subunit HisH
VKVAIIDCGSGNLRSAAKAFERMAAETGLALTVDVTQTADVLDEASHIVLPGQGAFAACLSGIERLAGMREALERNVVDRGKPFLGICVGMQLMADRGLEHGEFRGFGWIGGEVAPLAPNDPRLKVPHMGWKEIEFTTQHPILLGISPGAHAYFVHSFAFAHVAPLQVMARVNYGGTVVAIVARDNMIGTQFHPEKSQRTGLTLIRNFLKWSP